MCKFGCKASALNRHILPLAVACASCWTAFANAQSNEPTNARELSALLYKQYRIGCPINRDGEIWAASFSKHEVEDANKAIDIIVKIPTILMVQMNHYHLDKELLAKLHKLRKLKSLKMAYCKFEEDDLEALEDLSLTELDLTGTTITDAGLAHVKLIKNLAKLDLSQTSIAGTEFQELEPLPLRELNLTATPITDDSLKSIGRIHSLRNLDLSHTPITDDGLSHLSGLYLLRKLNVDEARTTHGGRDWFREDHTESRKDAEKRGLVPDGHPQLIIIEN